MTRRSFWFDPESLAESMTVVPIKSLRITFVCALIGMWLGGTSALAHPRYERVAGRFPRADGTSVTVVRHHVDGIITTDPVSIQFRSPDGAELARTEHVFDAIVRPVASGVEVYQYQTTWLPTASRVDSFDGYELKDITASRRLQSVLVHFSGHRIAYFVSIGLGVGLTGLYFALRAVPRRGWRGVVRKAGMGVDAVVGGLCAYDILVFEPVSKLVLACCAALIFGLIRVLGIGISRS
jgi:hypothetical protein